MALVKFGDLQVGKLPVVGPFQVSPLALETFLEITGERHPIHEKAGVVPGGFLHSLTAGAMISGTGAWDVKGLRTMNWRFLAPLRVAQDYYVQTEINELIPITENTGLVILQRRITGSENNLLATGRLELVVNR